MLRAVIVAELVRFKIKTFPMWCSLQQASEIVYQLSYITLFLPRYFILMEDTEGLVLTLYDRDGNAGGVQLSRIG